MYDQNSFLQPWYEAAQSNCIATYLKACRNYQQALAEHPDDPYLKDNCGWFIPPDPVLRPQPPSSPYHQSTISVLIVGFSRPEGAMRAATSAKVLALNPDKVEVLVCTDTSDPLKDRYEALPDTTVVICDDRRTSAKWNCLYERSTGDILVLVCDDVVFTTFGWDNTLRSRWPQDGMAVVNPTTPVMLLFPIISRKMADRLGYVAYPNITHGGLDTFWAHVGHALGRYYYPLRDCHIDHRHYETHEIHNQKQRYLAGEEFSPEGLKHLALTEVQNLK